MIISINFIVFNFLTILVMKLLGHKVTNQFSFKSFINYGFRLSPKTKTIKRNRTNSAFLIINFIKISVVFFFTHSIYKFIFIKFSISTLYKSYSLIPFVYIFTLYLGSIIQIFSLCLSEIPINIHKRPLLSKNIFEFWSLRWNIWIRDWLHSIGKTLPPNKRVLRTLLIFFISGLFHEFMLNIPYYLKTRHNLIGSMVLYFMIQFFGVLLDKKLVKYKKMRYLFMWIILIGPAPLFINQAFFNFFGY